MWKPILLAGALALWLAAPAFGQSDLFSAEAFAGQIDLRAVAADGEKSWVDGGFGKARFGGDSTGGLKPNLQIADAILEWRPNFAWGLSGVFDLEYQSDLDDPLGFTEAYLRFKPLTGGANHYSVRAGMFYPPVSLEHDGPSWTTTRTITPSAINSWIGEETKGTGLEGSVRHVGGEQELGLTVGAFESNDTAGTLLSLRGWSLNDVRTAARAHHPLPPLSPFIASIQPRMTTPSLELDHRIGYYVRGDWRPAGNLALNAEHYDNEGDMIAVNRDLEWSWRTQFENLGVQWKPSEDIEILAQVMWGRARMGFHSPAGIWVDVKYQSAYLLISRTLGESLLTGRLDVFSTDGQTSPVYGDTNEDGWAMTAAWRRTLTPHAQMFVEALHVESDRASRTLAGEAASQSQNVLQVSARLHF